MLAQYDVPKAMRPRIAFTVAMSRVGAWSGILELLSTNESFT